MESAGKVFFWLQNAILRYSINQYKFIIIKMVEETFLLLLNVEVVNFFLCIFLLRDESTFDKYCPREMNAAITLRA